MARVFSAQNPVCYRSLGKRSRVFVFGKDRIKNRIQAQPGSITWPGLIFSLIFILGVLYLYQVNSIATQGFEIRELEGKIQDAENEQKKLELREVELKSMHNIEKATQDLNLVSSEEFSYIDLNSPVAMK